MALEDKPKIEKEPMFCVEAMLLCLYWSLLVYDMEEVCTLTNDIMVWTERTFFELKDLLLRSWH